MLKNCIFEDFIFTAFSILLILFLGKQILSLFNPDTTVVETGYMRLLWIFSAYTFSMIYENMAGYLRGFGISLIPACLTVIGVCGVRIAWIETVFQAKRTFSSILSAYPASMAVTAILMITAAIAMKPSVRYRIIK